MADDSWRLYEDPDGYYSLRIPEDWTYHRSSSVGRHYKYGELQFVIPRFGTSFGPAPLVFHHLATECVMVVSVSGSMSNAHHTLFPNVGVPNATLGNIPAYHYGNEWQINLPEAYFTLNYGLVRPKYRATDDPDISPEQEQEAIGRFAVVAEAVIASFRPGVQSGWRG